MKKNKNRQPLFASRKLYLFCHRFPLITSREARRFLREDTELTRPRPLDLLFHQLLVPIPSRFVSSSHVVSCSCFQDLSCSPAARATRSLIAVNDCRWCSTSCVNRYRHCGPDLGEYREKMGKHATPGAGRHLDAAARSHEGQLA